MPAEPISILSRYLCAGQSPHTFGLVLEEAVDLTDGTIKDNDSVAMVGNIHDQILAHDSQADEAEISTGLCLHS